MQRVAGIFLKVFSALSLFMDCTDDPNLPIGESLTQYWLLLLILSQCPVAGGVFVKQPEFMYPFWRYSCFQSELFCTVGQCAVTFLPNPSTFLPHATALSAGCNANPAPASSSISRLSAPSAAIVLYQVLFLICCLLLYLSWCNCLWKWLLKHVFPLLFRTSEGHLVKSMSRTSYFWVPHSISKRCL